MEDNYKILKFSKNKSIKLCLVFWTLYWIINIISASVIYVFIPISHTDGYIKYMYISILSIIVTLVVFLKLIPDILEINKSNYKNFLKEIGIISEKKGYVITLLIIIVAIINLIVVPAKNINITLLITNMGPPIVEELIFRGVIMAVLLNSFSKRFSIFFSSLLFVLIHVMMGPMGMIGAIGGVLFAVLAVETGSIFPSMAMHYVLITFAYSVAWGMDLFTIAYAIFYLVRYRMSVIKHMKIKAKNQQ